MLPATRKRVSIVCEFNKESLQTVNSTSELKQSVFVSSPFLLFLWRDMINPFMLEVAHFLSVKNQTLAMNLSSRI